ncbi:hypothetical protein AGDE_11459 [Angomonas deanei]|uniref:SPRY domain containing protein n=1 Tax=Angomonas deanei TaxID=59799 RepID=A0A7G2C4C0_9TRYP|nr:hypothetical protein AGDE_11459 [Angomonas deanei]CAD2214459.1 hypothetical protein, conserved [Angomonas deanei]|eukprot:EPY26262.1 hypothetical protein AGDE_11459 [Angomonas deanei]
MATKVESLNTKDVETHPQTREAYLPVGKDVKCHTFHWTRANPIYKLEGTVATHRGGGEKPYTAVIGDLELLPNTGKHYFEYRINTDNCRIGFCTSSAYGTGKELNDREFGTVPPKADSTPNTPTYLQTIGAVAPPEKSSVAAYMEVQTAKAYVNGQFKKQLWRLFVASSGATFGFVVDTNLGVVQLFVDKVYQGLLFDESCNLKGVRLCPCVGIAGMDMHNRNIGECNLNVKVHDVKTFDGVY